MAPTKESKDSRPRRSRPLESTRISGVRGQENSKPTHESEQQNDPTRDSHDGRGVVNETLNDSENSAGFNSTYTIERPNHLKHEFNGLNHRLISYMDRVKQTETLLTAAESERQTLQDQLEKNRQQHTQQIEMLRLELDEHVRQAVMAEEKQSLLEKKVQNLHEERKTLKAELAARSQREASLERAVLSERTEVREARNKISQLQVRIERDDEQRKKIGDELTKLKVENARLHERMKIANMELTMQESKASEAEKKLQFTSEDVTKKLHEQRTQLEKLGMEKIDEIRRKHQAELARVKREHQTDKQKALVTYVSAEDYAKLDTQMKECFRKLQEAESTLSNREEKLRTAEERIASLTAEYERALLKERKRRERLSTKLIEQDKNHDDIRRELENYRKLIEGLDVNENVLFNTPLGAKRSRPSNEAASISDAHSKIPDCSKTPLIEARKVLARRVLTPIRKVAVTPSKNTKEEESVDKASAERDCKMM